MGQGNLLSLTDQAGKTTTYTYDASDRLLSVTNPLNQVTSYTYDPVGNLLTITDANGHTTSFTYDADNQQTKKTWPDGSFESFSYDVLGNLTSHQLTDGHTTTSSYDVMNRLTKLTYFDGTSVSSTYTPTGQRQTVTDSWGTTTYTYDNQNRLIQITTPGGQRVTYAYDAVGNRTSATINGQTTNYTYNSLDQLTSVGTTPYSYDGRGNLTQISAGSSATTYRYDAADRLVSATEPDGQSASYAYDADGRRVQQTVGTAVTNYLWDEASQYGDVVLETDGSGTTQASYVLGGDALLAQTRGGTTSYYLDDGQGNVRLLTTSSGGVTDSYTYDAFGNLLSSTGSTVNSYRYTGQQFDSLTGLYDLRARSYDPASGRFTSRDTASINFSNPVELNRYSYTHDNPVNLLDPSGHTVAEYVPPVAEDEEAAAALEGEEAATGGPPTEPERSWLRRIIETILETLARVLIDPFRGPDRAPGPDTGPQPQPEPNPPPGQQGGPEQQNEIRETYRGVGGSHNATQWTKPTLKANEYRADEDGLSTFELSTLATIQTTRNPYALRFILEGKQPIESEPAVVVGLPCRALYTPNELGKHWSIQCSSAPPDQFGYSPEYTQQVVLQYAIDSWKDNAAVGNFIRNPGFVGSPQEVNLIPAA
jgi:RHS repeat-associated protein